MKRNCFVKILVNPHATTSFILRFEILPKKEVYLKIMMQHINDLNNILDELKTQIPMRYDFNVIFNWKNCPNIIKDDKRVEEDIRKIFYIGIGRTSISDYTEEINRVDHNLDFIKLANIINIHVDNHGSAPDFKNNIDKNKIKIHNYIKTVLGMPKLTIEQTRIITNILNKTT
jgi:hypothetical protein